MGSRHHRILPRARRNLTAMSTVEQDRGTGEHTVSVVVPVYRGELTLGPLVGELLPFTQLSSTPAGRPWRLEEIVLVHDHGPDHSEEVIRKLVEAYDCVRAVWLSRNFGQHAATLAGMSSTGGEWIVSLDEDGQFNPADIGSLLDTALDGSAQLVYGVPSNTPPHGTARNLASQLAKAVANHLLTRGDLPRFSSFRLILGEIGRGVASYVGAGVYLDVALTWVVGTTALCPVKFRHLEARPSGYSFRRLLIHFAQLVITAGTRPLRLVSLAGALFALGGIVVALVLVVGRLLGAITVPGWTSVTVLLLLIGGANLFALGVVAEYVGAAVRMAMGKPLYLMTSDPTAGPLHKDASRGGSDTRND